MSTKNYIAIGFNADGVVLPDNFNGGEKLSKKDAHRIATNLSKQQGVIQAEVLESVLVVRPESS